MQLQDATQIMKNIVVGKVHEADIPQTSGYCTSSSGYSSLHHAKPMQPWSIW